MNIEILQKEVRNLVKKANFSLRDDVRRCLQQAYQEEKNKKAKKALRWILDNAEIAESENLAICQDTGLPIIFVEAGKNIKLSAVVIDAIKRSVETGYIKNYLRPSMVNPLTREKPSHKGVICHVDFSSKATGLKITILPKGFGSENKSQLMMFNPIASLMEIEKFVVDTVKKAGPEACPPFIIGIGIGGSSDYALLLAKKALLEKIDIPNPNKSLDALEKKLLKKINLLKIGPMGLGGRHTCLAVKIKKVSTHIAGLPVGINISCHALRSAVVQVRHGV